MFKHTTRSVYSLTLVLALSINFNACGKATSSDSNDTCEVKIELENQLFVNESINKTITPSLSYNSACSNISFEWKQLSGLKTSFVSIKESASVKLSIPKVEKEEVLKFQLKVKTDTKDFSKDIKIVVKDTLNRTADSNECHQFLSDELSQDDIHISTEKMQSIADALEISNPNNGYQLFLRNNEKFMQWIDMGTTLATAIHETNHNIDFKLSHKCTNKGDIKYFSLGDIYTTSFKGDNTEHYSTVSETIPSVLKGSSRYKLYIEGFKNATGNRFHVLLDELNAYVGDANFQLNFEESGLEKETTQYQAYRQFQINGVVNFMVFVEYYIKTARLHYPETYKVINRQENLDYLQYIWNEAEDVLIKSYPYLMEDSNVKYLFFSMGEKTSGLEHLKVAYSEEALLELNSLGLSHRNYDYWDSTYFSTLN